MKKETLLHVRYTVTDQHGNRVEHPAMLLWSMDASLHATVTKAARSEEAFLAQYDRYAESTIIHCCEVATKREQYVISTERYGETHTLILWCETCVPDVGYMGDTQCLFPKSRR